jgi:hypothetical protein
LNFILHSVIQKGYRTTGYRTRKKKIIIKYEYARDMIVILVQNINLQETVEDISMKYKYTRDSIGLQMSI